MQKKLNRDEAEKLEGEISFFELAKALKSIKVIQLQD